MAWREVTVGETRWAVAPVAERVAQEILSIPMYPELREEEIEYIIAKIKEFTNQKP